MELLSQLVLDYFLSNSTSNSIEHHFIRLYLITTFTLIISLSIIQKLTTTTNNNKHKHNQHPSIIIDIYIDFNHYQQQQHHINYFLSKLSSIINQSIQKEQQQQLNHQLVFWCYINTQNTHLNQWITQLEKLQADHSTQRFVHLIDTSDPQLVSPS
jgi:hypothetical protein